MMITMVDLLLLGGRDRALFFLLSLCCLLLMRLILLPDLSCRLEGVDKDARYVRAVFPFGKLALIESDVLTLQLSHFLNFIEVNDEALLICVFNLNALSAEDGSVV